MSQLILARGVSHYFGSKKALDNVDIELQPGKPIALVGPNGAGKTTLFSLICGYLQPSEGEIKVLGHRPGSAALFGQLSALPQDALLDPNFSVAQQLALYARLQGFSQRQAKIETQRVLELVNLKDTADSRAKELSHGMKKRICIAQALLGSPKLVMLDEATAGLDPANARAIRELVSALSTETTFVLSSHDLSELERLCDRVLYLQQGRLATHQLDSQTEQLAYLTLQLREQNDHVAAALKALPHVVSVDNSQRNEFVIGYSSEGLSEAMDIALLTLCHKQQWRYRALINGHTLENQLFATGA
ncbi:putative ABC transporter ATP-binding protein YxlF [Pseudoalteromonas sp. THAF3]|uniref:ABC transporter ATP-binding protein n=1 Tax=Pseudoalteromonas TaxID=53246 RepID=UPI000345F6C7|nr:MULTISPECIES: ABC transporter ATP-binding protein [Pseudoalteromonas]QFU04541.1 putative ABC transporter ATP-binding protein YxlF [Pseudoalteromonas sp. THAF3]RZF79856.1 ABC transporter ATP-binding protein [Pseudoalteromonas sp. CO325X]